MLEVGLVTTWNERCGLAEYAANLVDYSYDLPIKYKIVTRPLNHKVVYETTRGMQVVCVNYNATLFPGWSNDEFLSFRRRGQRVVLVFHDSTDQRIRQIAELDLVSAMVVHEHPESGTPFPVGVHTIYMGIRRTGSLHDGINMALGIAGFPLPWKGFVSTAQVAKELGLGYVAVMPQSRQADGSAIAAAVKALVPKAAIIRDWLDHDAVVRELSKCCVTVFPYEPGEHKLYGISGAVRFGLASGRPVALSRCRQFRDLFPYADELYFTDQGLGKTVQQAVQDVVSGHARVPDRLLSDMDWRRCAELYAKLFTELV